MATISHATGLEKTLLNVFLFTFEFCLPSIQVHAKRDDLGQGGNTGSTTTGNAGARLGCCIIHKVSYASS